MPERQYAHPPMPALAALLALLVAAPIPVPPSPGAIGTVPDEPGVVVLPDAPILQTVAADLDGDGRRELVRLVRGDGEAALAEVWVERGPTWAMLGEPVEVVPPSRIGTRIDDVYQATPVRLLVRRVDGVEHVTIASQPTFEELDVGEPCCLLLHDLVMEPGGVARRVEVADSSDFADAVLVIDLDGDGTDELLSTFSPPPARRVSFAIDARVHRWIDGRFADPAVSTLPAGAGDVPFVLGDSDGVPGDEAAIAGTIGPPQLNRIRLAPGDGLVMDAAGRAADQALAIPLGEGRGVAVSGIDGLIAAAWPAGEPISTPAGSSRLTDVQLIGTVEVDGEQHLALHRRETTALHLLALPGLEPRRSSLIGRSPAGERLALGPLSPFSGPLPVSDPGAAPEVAHGGNRVGAGPRPARMATLAGAQPIGLVGDATLVALHHGPFELAVAGPGGGALAVPAPLPSAWTSIVPVGLLREPEADAGDLEPEVRGALHLDRINELAVGGDGFTAEIVAPSGSRVVVSDGQALTSRVFVVPDAGALAVPLLRAAPGSEQSSSLQAVTLVVTTPAGHAYLAAWNVEVRTGPPPVEVDVTTDFGSSAVEIDGATLPGASVHVDGRSVEVDPAGHFAARAVLPPWPTDVVIEVDDSLGNVGRATVSGVGWFDYRALPWVPIVAAIVAVAALILLLRVPRLNPLPPRPDDDSALEELEPD